MNDLVERARAYANSHRLEGHVGKLFGKLADHIDALEAENKALREGLRPFADIAENDIVELETDRDLFRPMSPKYAKAKLLTVGDLRRARALLAKGDGK